MTQFYDVLAPVLGVGCGVALLLLVVFLLLGPTRKFWVVLLYVSYELLATITLTFADLHLHGTTQVGQSTEASRLYARLYWNNDVIEDLLRFVLVAVLIYMVAGSAKTFIGRMLSGTVLAMIVLPFLLFHPTFQPFPKVAWYNSTSQLLNFGAAIMNVILWGALIQSRKRDPQILAVSIGLGILVTGTSVSLGLRHFAPPGGFIAAFNLFLNLTQLAAWLIWCRAFWPPQRRQIPDRPVVLSQ
ncbi:MAG TPA: hypothetical protein VK752_26685 [Bryobacteraceae bacterium]|nr:hypothetical protein [Bryobacteraceae bacterium]